MYLRMQPSVLPWLGIEEECRSKARASQKKVGWHGGGWCCPVQQGTFLKYITIKSCQPLLFFIITSSFCSDFSALNNRIFCLFCYTETEPFFSDMRKRRLGAGLNVMLHKLKFHTGSMGG